MIRKHIRTGSHRSLQNCLLALFFHIGFREHRNLGNVIQQGRYYIAEFHDNGIIIGCFCTDIVLHQWFFGFTVQCTLKRIDDVCRLHLCPIVEFYSLFQMEGDGQIIFAKVPAFSKQRFCAGNSASVCCILIQVMQQRFIALSYYDCICAGHGCHWVQCPNVC